MEDKIEFKFTGILKEDSEGGPYRRLPERSTKASAGYDFFNPVDVTIEPHSLKLVKTKKKGVMLANSVGIVDADYYENPDNDGEIGFMFYNFTDETTTFNKGEKLGQGIFENYHTVTDEEEITTERVGGFGSTGK